MANIITTILIGFGLIFGCMLVFHLSLCFICWIGDVIDNKSWRYWR